MPYGFPYIRDIANVNGLKKEILLGKGEIHKGNCHAAGERAGIS